MPPSSADEEGQYDSSQDSDFAPDAGPAAAESDASASENDNDDADTTQVKKKRRVAKDTNAEDIGYDNSGDEAIIKKGEKKRQRKAKTKAPIAEDDDGGEGGLIKTRRQRAAEKEERKVAAASGPVTIDVDAVWQQMLAGAAASKATEQTKNAEEEPTQETSETTKAPETDLSEMVRIKRTYNFAGQVHTEEKMVHRDSAEAKLFFASQGQEVLPDAPPAKRVAKKAFRSAFEPLTDPLPQRADLNLGMAARLQAGKDAQAKKLNTVEKSRMDWAGYVDKEGIKDELELAGKSKHSYTARADFLARSEARRDDDARRVRLSGRT